MIFFRILRTKATLSHDGNSIMALVPFLCSSVTLSLHCFCIYLVFRHWVWDSRQIRRWICSWLQWVLQRSQCKIFVYRIWCFKQYLVPLIDSVLCVPAFSSFSLSLFVSLYTYIIEKWFVELHMNAVCAVCTQYL